MTKPEVIFFGNGPLADATLSVLQRHTNVIFHAKTRDDLETVKQLKTEHSEAHGVLASYGVLIKSDVLDLFEPEGILNLHPSKLPDLRGPSPIETAIARGDTTFGVSIMKLVRAMDAGPLYFQTALDFDDIAPKSEIYQKLAETGATWLVEHLENLPTPVDQDDKAATFSHLLDKSLSPLDPEKYTATELNNQIRAYLGFPKSRYRILGVDCIISEAHVAYPYTDDDLATPGQIIAEHGIIAIGCADNCFLVIDELQPAGKKPMDAKSFLNGYGKAL